jgi:hypothetical protein
MLRPLCTRVFHGMVPDVPLPLQTKYRMMRLSYLCAEIERCAQYEDLPTERLTYLLLEARVLCQGTVHCIEPPRVH